MKLRALLMLGLFAFCADQAPAQVTNLTLVPAGAVWRYLDNGSDQGSAWQTITFDDSVWPSGRAQLGYGDGDEFTTVSFGPDANFKHVTTYFRRAFVVNDASSITGLTVRLLRDDGGIVYLNGVEIFRSNMGGSNSFVNYLTLAANAIPNSDESIFFPANRDASALVNGTNVVAVEIHQATRSSSDMSFDLSLTGTAPTGPPVISRQPQNQVSAVGGTAVFSVTAVGSPPLQYQWQFNGDDLSGATNATLRLTGLTANDEGRYWVTIANGFDTVVSDKATLTLINLTGDFFQITSLTADNAQALEHAGFTGDDRGGIAASFSDLFVTGDNSTARFSLSDLSGGTALGQIRDSLASDLKSGKVYVLANGSTPLSAGVPINTLLELDTVSGALSTNAITLSTNVNMNGCGGCMGVFSGFGRIVLHSGSRAYVILLPSGEVQDLGPMATPQHQYSENWAYWGIAEYFAGSAWIVYVRDSQTIVRTRVPDGLTLTVGTFQNLSDMASFTVSPLFKRWYFHHQFTSQFRSGNETVGFADSAFAHEQQPQPPAILAQPRDRRVREGSNATFTVTALGYPLTYQWQFSGQDIADATNQTLTLTGVGAAQVGLYSVVVGNDLGRVTSSPALLDVVGGGGGVSSVAVFGAESATPWNDDVRQKIQATDFFDQVDAFQVAGGFPVPTLDQIQAYDAVLIYSDGGFNDPDTVGNVLADYVDDGGGVVLATFAFADSGNHIGGRLRRDDYLPFTTGTGNSGGPLTLVADNPSHPLLDGVGSFNGGSSSYRNSGLAPVSGAELVARWSSGEPLVGAKATGSASVVGLNFFPPSSDARNDLWDARTDGARLMANALIFAGRGGGRTVPGVPAGIRTQPADATALQGLDVRFSVTGFGSPTLAYQWLFKNAPIADATNRFLALNNVQTNQSGGYSVIITNAYGAVTSEVATLNVVPTRGVVGFYTDFNTASTGLVQSIVRAQFTPLRIDDISTFDLSRLSVLFLNELSEQPSPALRRRLPEIHEWVDEGGRLIIHQRYFNIEALTANPLLVGTREIVFTNTCCSADVNVSPGPLNLVVAGPHGTLNNASFDSGEQPYRAIAGAATLPPGTTSIFTAGSMNNQVVAFAYGLGAGLVYHSSLWLDYYLDYSSSQVGTIMRTVYAPNVIEYAAAYTASGPPTILAPPENFTATTGSEARFIVSARGQSVLRYQWLFNGTPLSNATNSSLRLSNISSNDAGIYSAIVSNDLGSQVSAGATLKVVARVSVVVFHDPRYVYTGLNTPADNVQAMLDQLGHTVRPFTNLLAALTNDVLLFPQFGPRELVPDLDSTTRSLLQAYVAQGGLLIVQGGYANANLLNSVFDLSLGVNGCYSGIELYRSSQAIGTPFADAPPTLAGNYCLFLASRETLPPSSVSLYTNQFLGSAVTLFPYGAGTLMHLGWTWDDAAPVGQQDGGWSSVLASAVQSRGVLTGWLSVSAPLVPAGSVWRYLDTGSDQGTAWRGTNFNDSSWASGPAQLGYGDGDESTVVSFGPDSNNKFVTTYFRRDFTVTDAASVSSLALRLRRDDGVAVYLNGVEIVRDCLPAGASFYAFAVCTIGDGDENQWLSYTVDPGLLRPGTNLLAVEIHQVNSTSSDISFDLELSTIVSATVPVIRTQPEGRIVTAGANVALNVVAAGELPLVYQWWLDEQSIPGATNAILFLNGITTTQSGRYSVVVSNALGSIVSADALVSVVTLGGDTFRIASLSTNNALVVDDEPFAGDDRGGIAASTERIFYTGDNGTARFGMADLSGGTNIGVLYDAMVSDLGTERVYSLAGSTNSSDLLNANGGVATTLLEIDGVTGQLTGSSVRLSKSIDLSGRYGQIGLFAGLGRIVVHDGTRAWNIEVASGQVVELGAVPVASRTYSENWAYWGVAEFFHGGVWLVYVRDSQTIIRTRVSDGFTETVATFDDLGDMASITVSLPFNRWYFHHQYSSQFSEFYETTGFADAGFVSSAPSIRPSVVTPPSNQTIAASGTVIHRVVARGTGPLRYQWLFEGTPLNGATNSTLTLTQLTTNQSGRYSVVVSNVLDSALSSAAMLTVVPLGGETFKIASLSTNNAMVVDDEGVAGSDWGAIAVSGQSAFYSGSSGTAQFDVTDLSGGKNVGFLVDGLISELGTETVYALGNGTNLVGINDDSVVTTLLVVDGLTGDLTGASLALSQPIDLRNHYGRIGFFAGLGRIVVTDGAQAWTIDTASGQVLGLGPMTVPEHHQTEVGAHWGVAEFFGGSIWLVYVRDSQTIVRTRVPDGATETVATFTDLSDMAAITVSVPFNRWYFHHQYNSQFSSFNGTLGFADATFESSLPPSAPSIARPPQSQSVGAGGTIEFNVVARGTAPLGYQWLLEGAALPGATSSTLTLTNVSLGQAGRYSVIVNNTSGSTTSVEALLRVVPSTTVAMFNDPAFVYTNEFGPVDNVRASLRRLGHLPASFTNILQAAGGSTPMLFPALEAGDLASTLTPSTRTAVQNFVGRGGTLIVHGTANDPARPTRFLNAVFDFSLLSLNVLLPSFRTAQADGTAFSDDPAAIPANAGTLGLISSALPSGARSIYEAEGGLTAVALMPYGSGRIIYLGWNWNNAVPVGLQNGGWLTALESAIEETVPPTGRAPEVLAQPLGRTAVVGTTVRLRVAAAGSPLTYQWWFNGQPLDGETNYVLQLNNVTTNRAGAYSVVVSNAFGSAVSSNAQLVVVPAVTVGVFDDPRFVNSSGGPYASADNVRASLLQLGHRAVPFTDISAATTNQVLVFPIFDQADLVSSLDAATRAALQSFVQQGGLLICHGYYNNIFFLNSLFDLSLSYYAYSGASSVLTAQANGTPFASGPGSLPYNDGTFSLYSSSLPAFGGRNIYSGPGGGDYLTSVALMPYGSGNLIYLGWNWQNAQPAGSQDGGWVETLGNAVLTRVVPSTTRPVITLQPQGQEVLAGLDVTFNIGGYGSQPLQLQWYLNGQPVAGKTNASLFLPFVNTNQGGDYFAVVRNPAGSATSQVARLMVQPTRGLVGYYTDYNTYFTGPTAPIQQAGFTSAHIYDITTYDLARLDILLIDQANSGLPSSALLSRLPAIEMWVNAGGKLIIHDRPLMPVAGQPNPLLLGTGGTVLTFNPGENIDILPPGGNLVVAGPHGNLNNASLDGAGTSHLGYARSDTLPPRALPILSAGPDATKIVAFSYGLGAGSVYYAAMPLDYFLENCCSPVWTTFKTVYTPNVIEHAIAFAVTGPPALFADPRPAAALAGGAVTLKVSVNGSGPLLYQWLFNDEPIEGATNVILNIPSLSTNQAGGYHVVVSNPLGAATSAVASVTVIQPAPFRITALNTTGSLIVDHDAITGDDRGGIGLSATHVFYTGDSASGRFSVTNLSGGTSLSRVYDGLVSNLRTETLYHLADGTNLISGSGAIVTALIEINGSTGVPTTNRVDLSSPILLGFDTGIFAGYGAVVLHTGGRAYRIELPSGLVLDLGEMASFPHASCENWAYWGVTEFFNGSVYIDYVRDSQTIVRTRVPDGFTTNLATFSNLSDMCSFTVSVPRNRWYFHHEGGSQFGGNSETLGYASATFDRPPRMSWTLVERTIAEDSTVGPLSFGVTDTETPVAQLVTVARSSNPVLLPAANIVLTGTTLTRTLTATPAPNQFGTSVVTVTVFDQLDQSTNRSFVLIVTPVNDPPSFTGGADVSRLEDCGPQSLPHWATNILSGPPNEADQALAFELTNSNPSLFLAPPAIAPDGTLTFTPAPDAVGFALVTAQLRDSAGTSAGGLDISPPQSFILTIAPVNDAPSFTRGADVTVLEDSGPQIIPGWAVNVLAGPVDESTQNLVFLVGNDNPGLFAAPPVIAPDGTLAFTPAANAYGAATVTVRLEDDGGTADGAANASATQTFPIMVLPANDRPSATPQSLTLAEDTALGLTLAGSDVDGDGLTFAITAQPAHGTLSGTGANRTYRPATNFVGADSFNFTARDGQLDSAEATVTINVTPVNDPPLANSQSLTTAEDSTLAVALTGSDVENDALTFAIVTPPAHGSLTGSGASRAYLPATNFFGPDSFTFKADDGQLDSAPTTITINVTSVNDAPLAVAQSVTAQQDTPLALTLSGLDVDADTLTYHIVTQPQHGTLSGTAANQTYAPASGYYGPDSFAFKVNDGQSDSGTATVSITVRLGNRPPVAVIAVSPLVFVSPDATNGVIISPNNSNAVVVLDGSQSSDIDNDPLSFAWSEEAGLPFATGAVVSNAFPVGSHTIKLVVSDGRTNATATATLQVVSAADAVAQIISFAERSSLAQSRKRPLIATLQTAVASFDRGNFTAGVNQFQAFQNKVRAQITPSDPALADAMIRSAQQVIDAMREAAGLAKVHARLTSGMRLPGGQLRFTLEGEANQSYTIQVSTDLVHWTAVTNFVSATGTNLLTEPAGPGFERRFYRAIIP